MGNKSPPAEGRGALRLADKNWFLADTGQSAHSEWHWQQECFSRSISRVDAFSNQHTSCSVSGLYSLYFPQRTRTNSVTFQLKISCSRLFPGSVPPIHLPKSLGGSTILSPAYFPQGKMKMTKCFLPYLFPIGAELYGKNAHQSQKPGYD